MGMACLVLLCVLWMLCGYAPAQGIGGDVAISHVKQGWPWKIPLPEGRGKGIAFLLGIDNRLTAYRLDTGEALWTFQMGLGMNEYMFNYIPILKHGARRLTYLLDDRGFLHAVDVNTGRVLWRSYDEMKFVYPPVLAGGWVIAVSEAGALYKLDAMTGTGMRPAEDASRIVYRERHIIARPTVIRDADESRPAYIVCLVEDRPGERAILFLDFSTGKVDPNFSSRIEVRDLRDRPVSAPLFSTGFYNPRGHSTMRVFIAARRGMNEVIYQKDYTNPRNPFTVFYKIMGGRLCEEPTFTQEGYVVLPNTSGELVVLRPDGKEMKKIPVAQMEGALSVQLVEQAKAAYGVLIVQTPETLASFQLNFQNRLGGFGRYYGFNVWAWPVISTRAAAQWTDRASPFIGEPRLPLKMLGDRLLMTSQVEDAAFLAVYPREPFLERERKAAPKAQYVKTTKPAGAEFLSFDLLEAGGRMLVGYGDRGTFVVDVRSRRILSHTPIKTKVAIGTEQGFLIFSESEDDGLYFGLLTRDLSGFRFKETHLPEEIAARPWVADQTVYFVTKGGVYSRPLAEKAEMLSLPTHASSPLAYHEQSVLIGTRSGYLDCLRADDLRKKWTLKVKGVVVAAPMVEAGAIYFGTDQGVVYGLPWENKSARFNRADPLFQMPLAKEGPVLAPPLKVGDALYIASSPVRGRTLLSKLDISRPDQPKQAWSGLFYGEVRQPMRVYRKNLIFASSERIIALDIGGEEPRKVWEEKLLDTVASPLLLKGDELYFICRDGSIYCLELVKSIF